MGKTMVIKGLGRYRTDGSVVSIQHFFPQLDGAFQAPGGEEVVTFVGGGREIPRFLFPNGGVLFGRPVITVPGVKQHFHVLVETNDAGEIPQERPVLFFVLYPDFVPDFNDITELLAPLAQASQMDVWIARIGRFPFKNFLFAPGRVRQELFRFCMSQKRFWFERAVLKRAADLPYYTVECGRKRAERVMPVVPGFPGICCSLEDGDDIFHLDQGAEILLIYTRLSILDPNFFSAHRN